MYISKGRKIKKITQEEYEQNKDKPEYGNGTEAFIWQDENNPNKYYYTVIEKRNCWSINSKSNWFLTFNSTEECKQHIRENFGGKWTFQRDNTYCKKYTNIEG